MEDTWERRRERVNSEQFSPEYSPKRKKVCEKIKKCSKDGKLWKVDCRKKTKREKMPKKLSLTFEWGDVKHTKLKQLKLSFLPLKTTKILFPYPHESFQKADWLPFGLQFVYYSMEWNPGRCDVTTSRHRRRHQRLPDSRQPQNKEISCPKLFLSTVTFVYDWTRAIVSTPVDGPWVAGGVTGIVD